MCERLRFTSRHLSTTRAIVCEQLTTIFYNICHDPRSSFKTRKAHEDTFSIWISNPGGSLWALSGDTWLKSDSKRLGTDHVKHEPTRVVLSWDGDGACGHAEDYEVLSVLPGIGSTHSENCGRSTTVLSAWLRHDDVRILRASWSHMLNSGGQNSGETLLLGPSACMIEMTSKDRACPFKPDDSGDQRRLPSSTGHSQQTKAMAHDALAKLFYGHLPILIGSAAHSSKM